MVNYIQTSDQTVDLSRKKFYNFGNWWSTYNTDWNTGSLIKFGSVSYTLPDILGSATASFSTDPGVRVTTKRLEPTQPDQLQGGLLWPVL
jgi:hypothetical protein